MVIVIIIVWEKKKTTTSKNRRYYPNTSFFDDVLKAVTPKEVFADASKEKALEREALIARAPKGTMKSAHALLANTVIDGEELTIAYDAREHGWTAKAFHERVGGKVRR